MSAAKNTGGPAFPQSFKRNVQSYNGGSEPVLVEVGGGMDLRDYAAIHADVPWSAAAETYEINHGRKPTVIELAAYVAELRYVMADAMITKREAA